MLNITYLNVPNIWSLRHPDCIESAPFKIQVEYRNSADSFKDIIASHHWHDFVQVWYTIHGSYKQHFRDMDFYLPEGSLLIVPPLISHATDGDKGVPVEVACIDFPVSFLNTIFTHAEDRRAFLLPFQNAEDAPPYILLTGRTKEQADALFGEINSLFAENPHKCMVLHRDKVRDLMLFISRLVQQATKGNYTPREQRHIGLVFKAMVYLEQNYSKPIQLESVCRHTALARTDFCRIFKQYTGNTFQEYLCLIRILNALASLTQTDKPISKIMAESGFPTKSNFNKLFKSIVGMTPREFRKSIHEYYLRRSAVRSRNSTA